jgi:hypothetical protein
MKIPEKIPYMFGEQLPNGTFVTRIIEIDKLDPRWEEVLKEYIMREGGSEVSTDRKVKKS